MFKTIEIEFRDNTKNKVVIDMTQDVNVVVNAMVDVFKEGVGEKFGETQAQALIDEQTKDIKSLLKTNLQTGIMTFHRIHFDDGTKTMPSFTVNKLN